MKNMLGKLALKYYKEGYNCSQSIIKVCDDFYKLNLDSQTYDILGCVSNGFGIGSICSVFAAGVMALGLMFDEKKAKTMRLVFLSEANKKFGAVNCPDVRGNMAKYGGCGRVIEETCEIIEKIIASS